MVQKVGQRVGEQFCDKNWFGECEFSSDGARKARLDFHNWFGISLHADIETVDSERRSSLCNEIATLNVDGSA